MIERLSLRVAVVASMTGCESDHSWAWIDPSGELFEVPDHGDWARDNFPAETYQEVLDNFDPQKWGRLPNQKITLAFLKAACYEPYQFAERVPAELLQRGTVYTIPDVARAEAERLKLPTLSMGSWSTRTKLNRVEERFLATRDLIPELVTVTTDNYWNRRVKREWENFSSSFLQHARSSASRALMKRGWVVVSNAYALGAESEPTSKQWDAFFRSVLACWKLAGLRPPLDREELTVSVKDTSYVTMAYSDAIDRYCSRQLQDEFYEYLLEGRPSLSRDRREEIQRQQDLESYGGTMYPQPSTPATPTTPTTPAARAKPKVLQERYPYRPRR